MRFHAKSLLKIKIREHVLSYCFFFCVFSSYSEATNVSKLPLVDLVFFLFFLFHLPKFYEYIFCLFLFQRPLCVIECRTAVILYAKLHIVSVQYVNGAVTHMYLNNKNHWLANGSHLKTIQSWQYFDFPFEQHYKINK